MKSTIIILEGDCAAKLGLLADGSVHLIVTSPPYDNLRNYNGHNVWNFEAVAKELFRVLAPGGVLCWNINDSVIDGSETLTSCEQKIFFRRECGFRIHDTMIWAKSNFAHPEKVRYHQLFEYVFILTKGAPRIFNPLKDKPNKYKGTGTFGRNSMRQPSGGMVLRKRNIIADFGMRGNVWTGNTRGQEELCHSLPHPSMMPKWLARDMILSWSNPGDTVLDPFAGSGTTVREAQSAGRRGIAIERNPEWVKLIHERTA